MADHQFNPDDVAVNNGNIFGFPVTEDEADLVLLPVPFDTTASLGKGTAAGPKGILEYSTQLDFYHHTVSNAWKQKIFWAPIPEDVIHQNNQFSEDVLTYIKNLEEGTDNFNHAIVQKVNAYQSELKSQLKNKALSLLHQGKKVGIIGGEHSVPLGLIEALGEQHESFGILQIDAHCDLRVGYEGFEQSHASIMSNALQTKGVKRLVQVGIRDASPKEMELAIADARISCFTDFYLHNQMYQGKTWRHLCKKIVDYLPDQVYISFDIDGLTPYHCPNTGTPVPGGLNFNQAVCLLWELKRQGKTIIGFDLCEVGVSENKLDENIGARILWELCCLSLFP